MILQCVPKNRAARQPASCQFLTARKNIANASLHVIVAIICIVSLVSSVTANYMLEDPSLSSVSPMNQPATGNHNNSWNSVALIVFFFLFRVLSACA